MPSYCGLSSRHPNRDTIPARDGFVVVGIQPNGLFPSRTRAPFDTYAANNAVPCDSIVQLADAVNPSSMQGRGHLCR
jgi:hypothetical protein